MSSNHKTVSRRQDVIGSNIRKSVVPGGFTSKFGAGKNGPQRRGITTQTIKEAARVALQKRGIDPSQDPCPYRDMKQTFVNRTPTLESASANSCSGTNPL